MVFFLFQLAFTCRKVTDEGAEKEIFWGGVSSQGSTECTKIVLGRVAQDFEKLTIGAKAVPLKFSTRKNNHIDFSFSFS